jgi:hypothetical protein
MPNRLEKPRPDASVKIPPKIRLKGFREVIAAELEARGWNEADLVRATEKRGRKIDDGYLRRMLKGQRFNEENIVMIADILNLPVYIGDVARPEIRVEAPPAPGSAQKSDRPGNVPIPVLPVSIVIQKPFRYDPWKVKDWAYINWRAFQAFRIESMACVKLSIETDEPLVRKEVLICIGTDARPPTKQVPPASVWAARKGECLVIGRLEEKETAILLVQNIPVNKVEVIASRDDIVGRVCWVWHSMV